MKKLLFILLFIPIHLFGTDYYVATTGNDANDGSIGSPWFTLNKAWDVAVGGDVIYMRGGTYSYNSEQYTSTSGSAGNLITTINYTGELPVITKGGSFTGDNWGLLVIQADYHYVKGLEIKGFTQESTGIWHGMVLWGSHNQLEKLNIHHNGGGLYLHTGSTDNLILNCDSHHNYDPIDDYGNADGFQVAFSAGTTVNTFRGCRSYRNSDDGFDCWQNNGVVNFENCWSWHNGYEEDGTTPAGNGMGFKMGETTTANGSIFGRVVTNCLVFRNRNHGIDLNSANTKMKIYNTVLYDNKYEGVQIYQYSLAHEIKNTVSYANDNNDYLILNAGNVVFSNNSYNATYQPAGPTVTDGDFVSVDSTGVSGARQADGSLPSIDFLRPITGSDLIDAGIYVGLDFEGTAPDIGAYEYTDPPVVPSGVTFKKVGSKFAKVNGKFAR